MEKTLDRIFCRGIVLFAYHGVFEEEASLGQRFEVDVDYYTDVTAYSRGDVASDAVRYDYVYETVRRTVVDGERVGLIETLAERIAAALLTDFPAIAKVRVEVRKPAAPVPGPIDTVGVEIVRTR